MKTRNVTGDIFPLVFVGDVIDELFGTGTGTGTSVYKEPKKWTSSWDMLPQVKRNIVDNEKEYSVEFCVPGLNKEDIDISLVKNLLTVSYKKSEEKPDERYYATESFSETFTLGKKCNLDTIQSEYKDGILKVWTEKIQEVIEEPEIIKIEVK